jgi:DNA-nicking Smr family endonuclease
MRRKRDLTEEERELFETTLEDAKPLRRMSSRPRKKKKIAPAAPVPEPPEPDPRPAAIVRRHTVGIDGNTADRLRRGLIAPQAHLDLHGLSERDAHRALVTFVRSARARKLRLILIVTGKGDRMGGRGSDDNSFDLGLEMQMRGILRLMTPRWLREPGLSELIADVREAHGRHGGSGALYVYLRKQSEKS